MKKKIYNVLIIGAGNIGAFYDTPKSKYVLTHAHAFSGHKNFKLIGFVDNDTKKAKEAAKIWGTKFFSSIDEAFSYSEIDVVCNSTPDAVHYEILKKILNKKVKLIFSEKPLTVELKEAKEIIKIAKNKKIAVAVNYRRRYVPEFIKLAEEIKAGLYGEFLTGTGYYGKGLKHNGSHLIDMLRLLLGEIKGSKIVNKTFDFRKDDPSLSAVLSFKNGKNLFLEYVDSRIYTIFELDLSFSGARFRIINSGDNIEKQLVKSDMKFKGYKNISEGLILKTSLDRSMYFAADNIYKYLVKGQKLFNSIEDSFKTMETTDKILHS